MSAAALAVIATLAVPTGEWVELVGFSRNERLAAWRTHVSVDNGDATFDRFAIITVVDAATREPLREYRGSPVVRVDADGRRIRGARPQHDAHPRYARAAARSEWNHLKRKARFRSKPLAMNDSALRLQPDTDVDLEATAHEKSIAARGAVGSPVGFRAVGRRLDGPLMNLGHFRREAEGGAQIAAEVRTSHSRSGYGVAVLTNFEVRYDDGRVERTGQIHIVRLKDAPIGTVYIGTLRLAKENMRIADDIYRNLHPETATHYNRLVHTGR